MKKKVIYKSNIRKCGERLGGIVWAGHVALLWQRRAQCAIFRQSALDRPYRFSRGALSAPKTGAACRPSRQLEFDSSGVFFRLFVEKHFLTRLYEDCFCNSECQVVAFNNKLGDADFIAH